MNGDVSERNSSVVFSLFDTDKLFRSIVETANEGIWVTDINAVTIFVNKQLTKILGFDRDEVIGRKAFDFMDEEAIRIANANLQRRKLGFNDSYEQKYIRKDGSAVWTTVAASPIFDSNGDMVAFLGMVTDITSKKCAEMALKESQERFSLAFAANHSALVICRLADNVIVDVNENFLRFLGKSRDEIVGKTITGTEEIPLKQEDLNVITDAFHKKGQIRNFEISFPDYCRNEINALLSVDKLEVLSEAYLLVTLQDVSQLKKTEKSLRKSEEQYRQLIETANSLIIKWTVDGNLTLVNEYALNYFGYTREEMIGHNVNMIVPETESSGRDLTGLVRDIVNNPVRYTRFENENVRKNGERVWISWTNRAILDEVGNITEILAVGNDITGLKKIEEEALAKTSEIEAILSCIPDGLKVYDTEARIMRINSAAMGFLKYQESDLNQKVADRLNKHFVVKTESGVILDVQDMPAYRAAVFGERVRNQILLLEGHGEKKWFIFNAGPLTLSGKHLGGVLSMLDITSLKQTEQMLLEKEERFRALADNISQMVWIANRQGEMQWFNKRWYDYTGVGIEEIRATGWDNLHHPDHASRVIDNFRSSIKNGLHWEDTFPVRAKNGEFRWFLSHALPIRDESGNVSLWFGTHTDVTELRNAESALQQQNVELIKAKEKAEESDRFKTAFLANISHEIRTPMTGILGFADLLKLPELSAIDKEKYLELIEISGKRMLQIINDLIDISKIEAGQIDLKIAEVNFNDLLNELLMFFVPDANKRGIFLKLSSNLPSDKVFSFTDKTKISQIMSNLIKNALKYTKEGTVEFGCSFVNGNYRFYVKDTGVGIKKELHGKIFERFTQGEVSWADKSEGVGLGLAISKAYAGLLGGEIFVESEPGKGSEFYFTIPWLEYSFSDIPVISEQKIQLKTVSTSKVLVAEDDEGIYFLLKEILRQHNIASVYARNGFEAVEKFKADPEIRLIIMDTKMPKLNGLDATREIKSINPGIPVIALSAYSSDADIQKAFQVGCDDYLVKPIERKILLEKIALYL